MVQFDRHASIESLFLYPLIMRTAKIPLLWYFSFWSNFFSIKESFWKIMHAVRQPVSKGNIWPVPESAEFGFQLQTSRREGAVPERGWRTLFDDVGPACGTKRRSWTSSIFPATRASWKTSFRRLRYRSNQDIILRLSISGILWINKKTLYLNGVEKS